MSAWWIRVWSVLAVLGLCGCGASAGVAGGEGEGDAELVKSSTAPVLYGVDERMQYGTHSDGSLRALARYSAAAMMTPDTLNIAPSGAVSFNGPTVKATHNLCDGQRFENEQVLAHCSATLIDDDLVLTSTVCFAAHSCANTRFVFNYFRTSDSTLNPNITTQDVFSCQSVVVSQPTPADFVIVRLDRPATPSHWVAPVRRNRAPLAQGLRIGSIGFSNGTAVKIDSGAIVLPQGSTPATKFPVSAETFYASQGSGLYYAETYELAGLISDPGVGIDNFVPGPAGSTPPGCKVAQVCPESGCTADRVTGSYIGPALDAYCAANSNPRLCQAQDSFSYSAANGSGVYKQAVFLDPGATINLGTCSMFGSSATGDTTISLIGPDGTAVAANDDACGTASWTTYTVPPTEGGRYQIYAGCFGSTSCSGTVAFTVKGPTGGTLSFNESVTNNAQQTSHDVEIPLNVGDTLTVGTCGLENTSFTGDTFLRLLTDPPDPANATVIATNDDACGGHGSQLTYTSTNGQAVRLKFGCWQNTACSGTLSYTIGTRAIAFSASNTNSAQQNTVNQTVHVFNGSKVTVGTCGLPGASFTGDTYVRLFNGSTQLLASDDACQGAGSRLTYRATATADLSVRLGCYSSGACNGNAVVRVIHPNSWNTQFAFNASNTASATQGTVNKALFLRAGDILSAGTCPNTQGGSGYGAGDTFLRLFGPSGIEVGLSDNNCTTGSSLLSKFNGFVVPPEGAGAYELRAGCALNTACSGAVGVAIP